MRPSIDRLARLGYEGIDMGFDYWTFEGSPFGADNYLEWARSLRAHADKVGILYTHAHASDVLGQCVVAPLSIHIQDNHGNRDEHLVPGDGTIDFDVFFFGA